MVQFFTAPTPRKDILQEQLGASLGQGLNEFTGNYFANKALQGVLNDPALKDAPMSQKMGALQTALSPYGERGQRMLEQRLQTFKQGQLEQSLSKARALMSDPTKSQQEKAMGLYELASVNPEAAKGIGNMMQYTLQQQQFGRETARNTAETINPEASPNAKGVAAKAGEKVAQEGGTPAQIEQATARKLTDIQDMLSKLKRSLTPAKLLTAPYRMLQGTYVPRQKRIEHEQKIAKPLIDDGLIDETREAMSESGKPLEWIEEVVKPLPAETIDLVKKVPEGSQPTGRLASLVSPPKFKGAEIKEKEQNQLNQSLENIFSQDPNVNIILLRKAFEEKKYDWNMFRDGINSMIDNGYKFNQDQQKQINEYLDQPPESLLDEIFSAAGLSGGR